MRHWLTGLADGHTVLRYDERGCGLSDRDVDDLSLDARVADLEAVVDAADVDRLALLGMSQGGPVAIAYAARHPDRVSNLILYATYARGRLRRDPSPSAREQAELMVSLIRMVWGRDQPAFRRLVTTLFIPDATPEQMQWFDDLQSATTDAETAVRILTARSHDDVTGSAAQVKSPTLGAASTTRRARSLLRGSPAGDADPGSEARPAREPQPHPARGRARMGALPRRAARVPRTDRQRHTR